MCELPENVMQDGATFYVFADDGETLLAQHFAPFEVRDSDLQKAREARQWFLSFHNAKES